MCVRACSLFKGLVPILMKQVPYTVVQLTTFQLTTDFAYNRFLPRVTGKSKDELPLSYVTRSRSRARCTRRAGHR